MIDISAKALRLITPNDRWQLAVLIFEFAPSKFEFEIYDLCYHYQLSITFSLFTFFVRVLCNHAGPYQHKFQQSRRRRTQDILGKPPTSDLRPTGAWCGHLPFRPPWLSSAWTGC